MTVLSNTLEWIDVHTHLNMLKSGVGESIDLASAAGVKRLITIGTNPGDHQTVLEIAKQYFPQVACTLGVHPHDAIQWNSEVCAFMKSALTEPYVVAVGEIGLDYFYKHSEVGVQKKAFIEQMELALEGKLPVEIHTRDADEDTAEIIGSFRGKVRGVFHCFSSSKWLAEKALDAGWNLSFSGIVTFKNAHELREIVKYVPLERLHVETDAPFLAPVPFRGKENIPQYVVHTAEKIAEIKQVSLEELCHQTKKNALAMFPKLSWN